MGKDGKEIEIIPPSRSRLPTHSNVVATRPSKCELPAPVDPGDYFAGPLVRSGARGRIKTYKTLEEKAQSEADCTRAYADLRKALTERALAWAEYDELPERIGAERHIRRMRRAHEIRELEQLAELREIHHHAAIIEAERALFDARSDLTSAQTRYTAAQEGLGDALQSLQAQRKYGAQYHELKWRRKLGEEALYVEEQEAILAEQRQRLGTTRSLEEQRVQMNADGRDTTKVEEKLARAQRRPWRSGNP
jgi:hypothetical protein